MRSQGVPVLCRSQRLNEANPGQFGPESDRRITAITLLWRRYFGGSAVVW